MLLGGVFVRDLRRTMEAFANSVRPQGGETAYERRSALEVERIVIHHVGGVNRDYTAEEIARYHVRERGWPGIAYHFLVHPDGRVEYIGDIATVRYHVGRINRSSLGICLAGDFNAVPPSRRQLMRTRMLVRGLWQALGTRVPVLGHRDVWMLTGYGFTECPGNTWPSWKAEVMADG